MGNAKYVGRVGALAVALGIGTAVATTPWVAVCRAVGGFVVRLWLLVIGRLNCYGFHKHGRLETRGANQHFGRRSHNAGHT